MAGTGETVPSLQPHPDAASWHRNAVDAARQTRVHLLVRSSIIGVGEDSPAEFISAHTACDRYLADSGLPLCEHPPQPVPAEHPRIDDPAIGPSGTFYANAGSVLCRASSCPFAQPGCRAGRTLPQAPAPSTPTSAASTPSSASPHAASYETLILQMPRVSIPGRRRALRLRAQASQKAPNACSAPRAGPPSELRLPSRRLRARWWQPTPVTECHPALDPTSRLPADSAFLFVMARSPRPAAQNCHSGVFAALVACGQPWPRR